MFEERGRLSFYSYTSDDRWTMKTESSWKIHWVSYLTAHSITHYLFKKIYFLYTYTHTNVKINWIFWTWILNTNYLRSDLLLWMLFVCTQFAISNIWIMVDKMSNFIVQIINKTKSDVDNLSKIESLGNWRLESIAAQNEFLLVKKFKTFATTRKWKPVRWELYWLHKKILNVFEFRIAKWDKNNETNAKQRIIFNLD